MRSIIRTMDRKVLTFNLFIVSIIGCILIAQAVNEDVDKPSTPSWHRDRIYLCHDNCLRRTIDNRHFSVRMCLNNCRDKKWHLEEVAPAPSPSSSSTNDPHPLPPLPPPPANHENEAIGKISSGNGILPIPHWLIDGVRECYHNCLLENNHLDGQVIVRMCLNKCWQLEKGPPRTSAPSSSSNSPHPRPPSSSPTYHDAEKMENYNLGLFEADQFVDVDEVQDNLD